MDRSMTRKEEVNLDMKPYEGCEFRPVDEIEFQLVREVWTEKEEKNPLKTRVHRLRFATTWGTTIELQTSNLHDLLRMFGRLLVAYDEAIRTLPPSDTRES